MAPGQQVYIMRGRWARRHASSDRDIVPLAFIRPSFNFEAADGDEGD
jgi:hypothetical protein